MRIGLAGVGRIGAFHARDSGGSRLRRRARRRPTPTPRRPTAWPTELGVGVRRRRRGAARVRRRRLRHRHRHPGPRAAAASGRRRRHAHVLREAGGLHSRRRPSDWPPRRGPPTCRCTSASSAASTPATAAPGPRWQSGELGFVHTIRAGTHDQAPPHAAYIPTSGGIFRDCNVHDFDIIRFVTGREVVSVYATGANKGAPFFSEAGDVDTAAAILTLDDGTLVHGLRRPATTAAATTSGMEVLGSKGTIAVGLDDSLALALGRAGRRPSRRAAALVVHGALPAGVPRRAHRLRRGRRAGERPSPVHRRRRPRRRSASPRRASSRGASAGPSTCPRSRER